MPAKHKTAEPRTTLPYTESELQALAEQLSQTFWQHSCLIPVRYNGRLSRTMGRFQFRTRGKKRVALNIELSKRAALTLDKATFQQVLLHELCHYHLFVQGQPFHDHHPFFEAELQRVGALSTNTLHLPQSFYELYCSQCHAFLGRRKRINLARYLSKCCQAPIIKKTIEKSWTY